MIDDIKNRLQIDPNPLDFVGSAVALELIRSSVELDASVAVNTLHPVSVYVIPLTERTQQMGTLSKKLMQEVDLTFGVLFCIQAENSELGNELEQAREYVRSQLFGWKPPQAEVGFQLGSSNLIKMQNGAMWWLDRFTIKCQRKTIQTQ